MTDENNPDNIDWPELPEGLPEPPPFFVPPHRAAAGDGSQPPPSPPADSYSPQPSTAPMGGVADSSSSEAAPLGADMFEMLFAEVQQIRILLEETLR